MPRAALALDTAVSEMARVSKRAASRAIPPCSRQRRTRLEPTTVRPVDLDLAFAGAARQAELLRGGELTSRELVEGYLGRIAKIDPSLNAFRLVYGERALA